MRNILQNILNLEPQNVSSIVTISCLGVWLVVWIVLIGDVLGSSRGVIAKSFWLLIVSVPLVGGILYGLFTLLTADWRAAITWRQQQPQLQAAASSDVPAPRGLKEKKS